MRARRRVAKRRRLDDLHEMSASEVFLRQVDLDLDHFARECSFDEHDTAVGVAGHGVAARDETIGCELHLPSVRR
jgi:hypothetical protein